MGLVFRERAGELKRERERERERVKERERESIKEKERETESERNTKTPGCHCHYTPWVDGSKTEIVIDLRHVYEI